MMIESILVVILPILTEYYYIVCFVILFIGLLGLSEALKTVLFLMKDTRKAFTTRPGPQVIKVDKDDK